MMDTNLVIGLQETVALAAVALVGYLFGRRKSHTGIKNRQEPQQAELEEATRIARQLENIADSLRKELALHHGQVARFKKSLKSATDGMGKESANALSQEAEAILGPTLQLATQLSESYDQIRQQSTALVTFSESRVDPVTGVGNERSLQERLLRLLTSLRKGGSQFSVSLIGIDILNHLVDDETSTDTEQLLQDVAGTIQRTMRENDFVARFGDNEFVVVLPLTSVSGASNFCERLRRRAAADLITTLSCGVAEAVGTDTGKTLLARADSALYSAKAAGSNRLFVHSGTQICEQDSSDRPAISATSQVT